MLPRVPHRLSFALAGMLLLTSCAGERTPAASVQDAWVRLPAAPGLPAAGYFAADLSSREDAIVAISSPSAQRVEMHEVVSRDGVSRMVPLERAARGSLQSLRFEPAGKHLMIHGLDPALTPDGTIELAFRFALAPPTSVRARLIAPGAGPPEQGGHAGQ